MARFNRSIPLVFKFLQENALGKQSCMTNTLWEEKRNRHGNQCILFVEVEFTPNPREFSSLWSTNGIARELILDKGENQIESKPNTVR